MGKRSELRFERPEWEPLRWPVDKRVWLRERGICPLPVKLVELWIRGCRLDAGYVIKTGSTVAIRMGVMSPLHGYVRAFDGRFADIEFATPLHPSIVRHICISET